MAWWFDWLNPPASAGTTNLPDSRYRPDYVDRIDPARFEAAQTTLDRAIPGASGTTAGKTASAQALYGVSSGPLSYDTGNAVDIPGALETVRSWLPPSMIFQATADAGRKAAGGLSAGIMGATRMLIAIVVIMLLVLLIVRRVT